MEPRDLSAHSVYRAGRGIEEVARELGLDPDDLVKLSSNENVLGPSPAATAVIREYADKVHIYPKSSHTDLIERLADDWDLAPEQVWLANGGDGVLDCLCRAVLRPDERILVPRPGFAYYSMSARYHHGGVSEYYLDEDDDFRQTAQNVLDAYDGERIVVVTSPHNPTGSEIPIGEVETLAEETDEETLVLVDEAYGEFSDRASAVSLVRERDDVAVLRTFSKAYGLAGMRLGYGLVPEDWADAYSRVHTPFDTGELTCRAGLAALDDEDHLEQTRAMVRDAREYLYENLDAPTWESAGNFVLADVGDGAAVTDAAQREGVIVRDCSSFGLPECIRITCGTQSQMERAVSVLNEVIEA
ncbi:histidinol-phosphate transaminase [Halorientalis salina]|uniref:histidinol-phosphate transaminase n=1 Tax=Halorientalis salina TaxID=2932266 RepID=UPI0010AC42F3|nr:histidinol-phosphate transaminase [Halorientalis salina]